MYVCVLIWIIVCCVFFFFMIWDIVSYFGNEWFDVLDNENYFYFFFCGISGVI